MTCAQVIEGCDCCLRDDSVMVADKTTWVRNGTTFGEIKSFVDVSLS